MTICRAGFKTPPGFFSTPPAPRAPVPDFGRTLVLFDVAPFGSVVIRRKLLRT
jgi:hypothetical protein